MIMLESPMRAACPRRQTHGSRPGAAPPRLRHQHTRSSTRVKAVAVHARHTAATATPHAQAHQHSKCTHLHHPTCLHEGVCGVAVAIVAASLAAGGGRGRLCPRAEVICCHPVPVCSVQRDTGGGGGHRLRSESLPVQGGALANSSNGSATAAATAGSTHTPDLLASFTAPGSPAVAALVFSSSFLLLPPCCCCAPPSPAAVFRRRRSSSSSSDGAGVAWPDEASSARAASMVRCGVCSVCVRVVLVSVVWWEMRHLHARCGASSTARV